MPDIHMARTRSQLQDNIQTAKENMRRAREDAEMQSHPHEYTPEQWYAWWHGIVFAMRLQNGELPGNKIKCGDKQRGDYGYI